MDDGAASLARKAAASLAGEYGGALPALVERQLADPDAPPERFTGIETAIAVAALLVSIAQLAWQIHRDRKQDAAAAKTAAAPPPPAAPTPDALARTLRLYIEVPAGLTAADRDRMIAVIVEDVTATDREA